MQVPTVIRRGLAFNSYNRQAWVAGQASQIPPGSRVLDVGAGTGPYRSLFAHCLYRTQDFGQEPGTVGNYTHLDYQSDITAIPVPDQSFDVVLCTEVLEHVPYPVAAVQEFARILRPGARLLITAPLGSHLHQEPYHFYAGYTPHWYRKFLTEAGFEIASIEANRGFFGFFAQEGVRFASLISPRRTRCGRLAWPWLAALWVLTLPLLWGVFPVLGLALDRLGLEHVSTVGYYVAAIRQSPQDPT